MHFIVHSDIDEGSIRANLGRPEYSYYFVLQAFLPALRQLGSVEIVRDPLNEADAIFDRCTVRGEACLHVSFSPPNKTPLGLRCPSIVVFAWEFSNIPDEAWEGEARNDWRVAFRELGRTITLSSHTARTVTAAMGEDFEVRAIAAPVWDRFANLRKSESRPVIAGAELRIDGIVIDSPQLGLSADLLVPPLRTKAYPKREGAKGEADVDAEAKSDEGVSQTPNAAEAEMVAQGDMGAWHSKAPIAPGPVALSLRHRLGLAKQRAIAWYRLGLRDSLPQPLARSISFAGRLGEATLRAALRRPAPAPAETGPAPNGNGRSEEPPGTLIRLGGVVYVSVLGPTDGRKNWQDMVTGFCFAFRDTPDATLVLKMVHHDFAAYRDTLILMLSRLAPIKCRVIAIQAYLEDEAFQNLIRATSYYVSTSLGEGLCLPLMEFMACGKPVIAPCHTAMEDYVDAQNAFVLTSSRQYSVWPHDPRMMFRSERYRLDWGSLVAAYRDSYRVAKTEPARFAAMAEHAERRIHDVASTAAVTEKLRDFLDLPEETAPIAAAQSESAPLVAAEPA